MILQLKIKAAWWLKLYLYAVIAWAWAFDLEPDMTKVDRWIERGVKAKVIK